jgi:hypothetical protein
MECEAETKNALFRRIIIESKARQQAKRELLLRILARAGSVLTEADRARIAEGSGVDLDRWVAEAEASAVEQQRIDRGKRDGLRDALLRLLTRAGIPLTDDDRARIQACTDTATLDRWVENVLGAKSAADVLS